MNLIVKVLLIAVVLVVILAVVRFATSGQPKQISEQQAVSNVTAFLKTNYPAANINITSVTPSSSYAGSWDVIASVVLNITSPCPSFYSYSFTYPQFRFVYQVENTYAAGCTTNEQNVTSPAVAITMASQVPQIQALRSRYSDYNIKTNYQYLAQYDVSTVSSTRNYADVWLVTYTTPFASNSINVALLQQNGSVIRVFNSSS